MPCRLGSRPSKSYEELVLSVSRKTNRCTEENFDASAMPHPLGNFTLREMLYFTAYHCLHHHNLIEVAIADNDKNN